MKNLIAQSVEFAEQGMLKENPVDYGKDGNFPAEGDFLDFTKIGGPNVYLYRTANDWECSAKTYEKVASEVSTVTRQRNYECADFHEYFDPSTTQKSLLFDLIIDLKATSLFMGAVALVPAFFALW